MTDYERDSTEKVMELIEHLSYIENELHKMIAMKEEGRASDNEDLKMGVKYSSTKLTQNMTAK